MAGKDNLKTAGDGNGWVSCGIPAPQSDHADFWQLWAQSKDSRKCPCGEMVVSGPCPVCGRNYEPAGK